MKISQMKNKTNHLNNFIYFNDEWQRPTKQTSQQGGGTPGSANKTKDDSKESWGSK
jgi:hypothetical protein